jgi:hypothetical protein
MVEFALSAALLLAASVPVSHAADAAAPPPAKAQAREPVYGSQLMTPEERDAYRAKMSSAKTDAERERIRREHHDAMTARARERGITLPAEPRTPARAAPKGSGPGTGPGPGPGPRGGPAR